jgi:hypothetical protein
MSDSSNDGDDPDRARNGTFLKGHKKRGGRKAGTPNVLSPTLKEGMLLAAQQSGRDGQGMGGRIGYLRFLAAEHPAFFGRHLLAKLIK